MTAQLVLGILMVGVAARATTFYCDPIMGSMQGDGSAARPWRTIEDVLQARLIQLRDPNELQGIGCFDGPLVHFTVEDNVVGVNHWHGITLGDAQGCGIRNNACFSRWSGRARPWVQVGQKKNLARGNTVRDNLAHGFDLSADAEVKAEDDRLVTEAESQKRLAELASVIDGRFGKRHPTADRPRLEPH